MSGMDLLLQAASIGNSDSSVRNASCGTGDNKRSFLQSNSHGVATNANTQWLQSSPISRAGSTISLPPKKRLKLTFQNSSCEHSMNKGSVPLRRNPLSLASVATVVSSASSQGSSVIDSSTRNYEWTDSAITEATRTKNNLLHLCDSVHVPKRQDAAHKFGHGRRSASKKKSNGSSCPKPRCGLSNQSSSDMKSLTDVDGNDMCMGYFSMPRRQPTIDVLPTTVMNPPEEHQVEDMKQPGPTSIHQNLIRSRSAEKSFSSENKTSDVKSETNQAMSAKSLLYQAYLQALQSPIKESR